MGYNRVVYELECWINIYTYAVQMHISIDKSHDWVIIVSGNNGSNNDSHNNEKWSVNNKSDILFVHLFVGECFTWKIWIGNLSTYCSLNQNRHTNGICRSIDMHIHKIHTVIHRERMDYDFSGLLTIGTPNSYCNALFEIWNIWSDLGYLFAYICFFFFLILYIYVIGYC